MTDEEYTQNGLRIVDEDEVFDNLIKPDFRDTGTHSTMNESLITDDHKPKCKAIDAEGFRCNQVVSTTSKKYCYYHEKVMKGHIKPKETP